jgi:hypothetical protein
MTPETPAVSALAPVAPPGVPPLEGGPVPSLPPEGAGGKTPRPVARSQRAPQPGGGPSSPLPPSVAEGRAAAGKAVPGTRREARPDPGRRAAFPGRGRQQSPAGASGTPVSPPAGTSGEQRAAQRDAWKRAQSGLKHRQRAGRGRYTRVADRGVTARLKPGMVRRAPLLDEGTGEAP